MCTERTFDFLSVYYSWACPSLWSTKYDHWPSNSLCIVVFTSMFLNCFNFLDTAVHCLAHSLVHSDMIFRIDTIVHFIFCFYKDRIPSASLEEILYFFMRHTCKYSRVANLVSIHMKDWKNRTICDRI